MKFNQMMKSITFLLAIFVLNIAFASEDQTCQSYEMIDGKKYCVKESLIPLNSCGVQSDWPCMDPEGCLGITQFIKE